MTTKNMVFSVQDNGNFQIFSNGVKAGIIGKSEGSELWHIDNDKQAQRFNPFSSSLAAKNYALENKEAF